MTGETIERVDADRLAREGLALTAARDELGQDGITWVLSQLDDASVALVVHRTVRLAAALVREVGRIYDLSPSEVIALIEDGESPGQGVE